MERGSSYQNVEETSQPSPTHTEEEVARTLKGTQPNKVPGIEKVNWKSSRNLLETPYLKHGTDLCNTPMSSGNTTPSLSWQAIDNSKKKKW